MTLGGTTLFISGDSRGIGLAIALRAARDGANVALIAKTAEPHPKLEGTVYTAAAQIEVHRRRAHAPLSIRREAPTSRAKVIAEWRRLCGESCSHAPTPAVQARRRTVVSRNERLATRRGKQDVDVAAAARRDVGEDLADAVGDELAKASA
jgi:NAD(P)-dependent dehydrogenase (short-subunit alcohol dehydrogenase family)